ncbi:MAG: hypothetical protein ABI181_11790 [Mycobacteriaceae bacterium]
MSRLRAGLRGVAWPRPLLVTAPGATALRWSVQARVRELGWREALSPAQADLLVVCGAPGPGLARALATVWVQLPTPRARVDVTTAADLARLEEGRQQLGDDGFQRAEEAARAPSPADQEMAPGGLGMAERGADRDGLSLDQLHPVWGPVLAHWPAGLRVELTMQGDVVQQATVHLVDEPAEAERVEPRARAADDLAQVLAVLGWEHASVRAARVRDELLGGREELVAGLVARVRRSRGVRVLTQGVGVLDGADAHTRVLGLLDELAGLEAPAAASRERSLHALPGMLAGIEVADARTVVASLPLAPVLSREPVRG